MYSKFLLPLVCSLIASVLCTPLPRQLQGRSADPDVQTCGNDQPASSEVNCAYNAPRPSALNISCTALLLFMDAWNTCHRSQADGAQGSCCIPKINISTDISSESILTNFADREYGEGRELEKFGEEVCAKEEAKSKTNNPNQFAKCIEVLSKVRATVDSIRQLLFSHKYGCEGKHGFNPEAGLVVARRNKPCTVAGFSHWAAQFGDKIHTIMYNAKGSEYTTASCPGYRKPSYPDCTYKLHLEY